MDDYFTAALVGEDEALVAARESGAATTMPNAEVAAKQGAFLGLLTRIAGARRVLELGTLAGYSTIWFARAVGPRAVIIIDNVVRDGAVVRAHSDDPRVQGVRRVVDDIAGHPALDATALQTVGVKGWDGLVLARRR